ncbi:MAG TPA: neutral zinc metallopeptidase [Terriglobia bacterium]|nr:neutral zinc metallopeptidase [Terriglobia bacterium]
MDWSGGRRSTNIEDRRGMRLGRGIVGGGLGTLAVVIIGLLLGVDPSVIINNSGYETEPAAVQPSSPADDAAKDFVSAVVGYTEDTWSEIFREGGGTYRAPGLVLFTGAVESACGFGQAAMGPFYCPPDQKVYLDLSFFQELRDKFQAPGDFAQAYVIAHEVGHHVQNLLGISQQVQNYQQSARQREANQASVRLELQADCLAGVWANRTERTQRSQSRKFLEIGDIEEALGAASMIGDDKLQMESRGYVVPESFTHGSAEQRMRWFKQGFQSGTVEGCNTFN